MALIDLKQVKHGPQFLTDVNGAVEKAAVITEPSDVPSDELIPAETYVNAKLDELVESIPKKMETSLDITGNDPVTKINLPSIPNDEPIKLIINGVEYHESKDFTVDRSTGEVIWTGGFPLTGNTVDSIKAVYTTKAQSKSSFPKAQHIMGMVLVDTDVPKYHVRQEPKYSIEEPISKGEWHRIDQHFNEIDFDPNHGTWAGIQTVTTSCDNFIEIPITWVKTETLQSGPYAGHNCWWIADGEAPGFHVHPAFIKPDGTPGKLRVCVNATRLPDEVVGNTDTITTVNDDEEVVYFDNVSYNNLWEKGLSYNNDDETGYRAYSIYDHHFLIRMMLIEFGDPNIMFVEYDGVWSARIASFFGGIDLKEKPNDDQINAPYNYHGIKEILGNPYEQILLYGLTTLNGTYQVLASDGSGRMVETGISCPTGGTWVVNCRLDKVNGVDFGDLFINNGENIDDYVYFDMCNVYGEEDYIAKANFCDYQFIVPNTAVVTQYEAEYNYSGLFMLNSTPINNENDDFMYKSCWRLVQVV